MIISRMLSARKSSLAVGALAFLMLVGTSFAQQEQQRRQQQNQQQQERNIIDTLREKGNFTKLLELIRTAKLEETLTQRGPFTLFAPTDEAINQIPQNQLNQLRQDETQLRQLLQRHVIQGELTAAELARQGQINPLEGGALQVRAVGAQTGQARQSQLNRERETPVRQGQSAREIQQRQQGRQLGQQQQQGQLPSNIAPDDQLVVMLIPKNDPSGVKIIQMEAQQFLNQQSEELIAKLNEARPGQPEQVGVREGDQQGMSLMIGSARVVEPNIQATNGIIHAIDKVLTQQNTQQ